MTDLSDLDALISREIGHKDRRTELAAARREPASPDQAARILVLEEALDWHPVSQHLLGVQHACECGSTTLTYTGLLIRQNHRRDKTAVRWVRVTRTRPELPWGDRLIETLGIPACDICSPVVANQFLKFEPFPDVLGAYNGSPQTPSPDGTPHPDRGHSLREAEAAPLQPSPRPDTSWGVQPVLREALARLLLPAAGRLPTHLGV